MIRNPAHEKSMIMSPDDDESGSARCCKIPLVPGFQVSGLARHADRVLAVGMIRLGRGFQGWRDMQFACLPWGCDDESAKVELALAAKMGRG